MDWDDARGLTMELTTLYLILLFLCLVLSAFFSGSEAAFLSARRLRILHMEATGVPGAKRVARMLEHREKVLPTILLGNNLVNTSFAALATILFVGSLGERQGVIVATAVGTVILLLLGEVLPKTLALRHAERAALLLARPLLWAERLFLPAVVLIQWASHKITSLVGGDRRALVIEEEIKLLITAGQRMGALVEEEAEMLQKVFRFGDRQVREVMTPRTEIVWVEKSTTLRKFLDLYAEHDYTRFPVYDDSLDNVTGILSVKDVVAAMARDGISHDSLVTNAMRPAYFVPETKFISSLFDEMRRSGDQMVMVADEFGGVAGLVTMKRLVEEIVGRVEEEGKETEEEYEAIGENTFQVDGGMAISDANEEIDLGLPEGEYETVAGLILETLGRIPRVGEHFHLKDMRFEVTEMSGLKIEKVTISKGVLARERKTS